MITLSGDTTFFPDTKRNNKTIINFYSSECPICMTEIGDIILFAKSNNVNIIFISADSLVSIQRFASNLDAHIKGIQSKIMFGQVTLQDMNTLFGEFTVPQTLVLNEDCTIVGIKKGMVSIKFLRKSFE